MYIKFMLAQLKVFGMVLIGIIIFPFILYPKRRKIWAMKDDPLKKWYWYFSDTFESGFGSDENNYLNSTYGVYEFVRKKDAQGNWIPDYERFESFSKIKKWYLSYTWMGFRNGAWNYIIATGPKVGEWENVNCKVDIGEGGCKIWRNKSLHGKQSITWEVEGEKYFRYSFTKKAKWYNIQRFFTLIFAFKYHRYYNFMWGASTNRYLVKSRTFNVTEN